MSCKYLVNIKIKIIKNVCKKSVENNLVKIRLVGPGHLIKVSLMQKKTVNIKAKLCANKLVLKFSRHRVDRCNRYKIGRDELMQLRLTKRNACRAKWQWQTRPRRRPHSDQGDRCGQKFATRPSQQVVSVRCHMKRG